MIDPRGLGNVVAEYVDDELTSHYVYGLGRIGRASGRRQLPGSSSTWMNWAQSWGLSNADGVYENSYVFDPFGNVLSQNGSLANPFQFVGGFGVTAESNGLYYMRNRFYDSDDGRFISEDPLVYPGGGAYTYVDNNPLQFIDPLGLWKNG